MMRSKWSFKILLTFFFTGQYRIGLSVLPIGLWFVFLWKNK